MKKYKEYWPKSDYIKEKEQSEDVTRDRKKRKGDE